MIKSYIIFVPISKRSIDCAKQSVKIAKEVGEVDVELWEGVNKFDSWKIMDDKNLRYRSVNKSYIGSGYIDCEIGAFLSHMSLWEKCVELNDRIMVMEHDAVFKNKFEDYYYDGILNLGRPNWGSRVWDGEGVVERQNCDKVHNPHDPNSRFHFSQESCQCDSKWLFGAHTYIITPRVAKILIEDAQKNGIYATDIFIRTDLVNIADQLPHSTVQESDFSLIQKPHNTELKSSNEAWS